MVRISARFVFVLFLLLLLDQGLNAWAGEAVLTWDPNTEADLAGYKVYTGVVSGLYGAPVDVGKATTYTVPNLIAGQVYYFAVTAYNTAGLESGYSNQVVKSIPLPVDVAAPLLSTITASGLTLTSATITWGTNEPADTRIEYGTTLSYGLTTPLVPSLVTVHSQALSGLQPGTLYHYRVLSRDAAGNLATSLDNIFTTLADTASPSVPGGVAATAFSVSQINLSWSASTDNVGVAGYRIYRNGIQTGTSVLTSYSDTGLTADTAYTYSVAAYDAAGNLSALSAAIGARTLRPPDTTPPTAPAGLVATAASATLINLSWTAASDNVGVTGYRIYRNGAQIGTAAATSYSDAGLAASTTYSYTVAAYDAAGNLSAQSAAVSAATLAPPDATPPSIPAGLAAALFSNQIYLTWSAAADDVGVAGYRIYRNGAQIATSVSPAYLDGGLAPNTIYSYQVAAYDAAGNLSPASPALSAATLPLPPVVSQAAAANLAAAAATLSGTVDPSGAVTTAWFEYGVTTAYGGSTAPVSVSSAGVVSANLASLLAATTYHFRLVARNAGGTAYGADTSFVTPALPAGPPPVQLPPSQPGSYALTQETFAWITPPTPLATFSGDDNVTSFPLPFSFPFYGQSYQQLFISTNGLITFGAANTAFIPQPIPSLQQPNAFIAPFWRDLYVGVKQISYASSDSEVVIAFNGVRDLCCSTPTHTFEVILRPDGTIILQYGTVAMNVATTIGIENQDGSGGVAVPSVTSNSAFRITPNTAPAAPPPPLDTTPPALSGIGAGSVTHAAATIVWTSSEPATTQVEYGITAAYGSLSAPESALVAAHSVALSGLSPSTLYHYRVLSRDAAGNLATSADATFTTAAPPDTAAPSVPAAPAATAASSSQVNLTWSASTDNVGVSGYRIYRNGVLVGTSSTTSYADTGLAASTTYSYTVAAYDAAGNVSAQSVAVSVATLAPPDTVPPVVSGVTAGSITASGAMISWSTNEPSDTQVEYGTTTAYGASTPVVSTPVTAHFQSLTGLPASTLYHYRVKSRDAAGNLAVSADATFITAAPPDTVAPSVPTALTATAASSSQVNLTWGASTDNVGVSGYRIYRNGVLFSATSLQSYSDSGLAAGTTYSYTLSAYDAAGNVSAQTAAVSITTPSAAATTVTLVPAADTFLKIDTTANGGATTLNTYTWPANRAANAVLMKFNLSTLPAGAIIQSATLNLSLVEADATADASYTVTVHKLINKNPDLARASGYTYDGTNAWTANACCYNNIPLAQADISAPYDSKAIDKTLGTKSWNLTAMIQEWVAAPAANYGLLLNSDATKGADRYRFFASMEHPTASLRPSLTVTYRLP